MPSPVEQEHGPHTPFVWASIRIDKRLYETREPKLLHDLDRLMRGEDTYLCLGWRRGGQRQDDAAVRLKDVFEVLAELQLSPVAREPVRLAAVHILSYLLRPLVDSLRQMGAKPASDAVYVIIPSDLGRLGRVAMIRAIRRLGVPHPRLIPRAFALGAHGLLVSGTNDWLCLDSDTKGLGLYRYAGSLESDRMGVEVLDGQPFPGLGWPMLVEALDRESMRSGIEADMANQDILSALFGVGERRETGWTWGSLETALSGPIGRSYGDAVAKILPGAVAAMGGGKLVFSGPCFMMARVERLTREALGVGEIFDDTLAPMRAARGVAALAAWLGESSWRRVEFTRRDGLCCASGGASHRLLSAASLARVGAKGRTFQRQIRVQAPPGHTLEVLGIDFLQGLGDACLDGVGLGSWSREIDLQEKAFEATLDMTVTVRIPDTGSRPQGEARLRLRGTEDVIRLDFVPLGVVLTTGAVGA